MGVRERLRKCWGHSTITVINDSTYDPEGPNWWQEPATHAEELTLIPNTPDAQRAMHDLQVASVGLVAALADRRRGDLSSMSMALEGIRIAQAVYFEAVSTDPSTVPGLGETLTSEPESRD